MKKIVLNSYIEGNMEELYRYYKENLEEELKGEYKVKLISAKNYDKNKFLHYMERIQQMLGRYDVHLTDFSITLSKRSKHNIFISHGYGTKATPGKNDLNNKAKIKFCRNVRENMDYLVTLGKRDATYFMRSDELDKYKEANYIELGLPRNDVLFDENFVEQNSKRVREKFNVEGKKILLYCPTWREWEIEKPPFTRKAFEKLNEFLGENGWVMMYRGHYIKGLVSKELIEGLDNIMVAGFDTEPFTQALVCAADVLITDYSSIYVDYLILNRPIVFMNFDKEEYNNKRGLAIDFNNKVETPGVETENIEEMIEYLKELDSGNDIYKQHRLDSQELFYEYFDGNSCKRMWDLIIDLSKK